MADSREKFPSGEEGHERESGLADPVRAAGLTVDQGEDAEDLGPFRAEDADRLQGAPAPGEGVLDHDDRDALHGASFHPLPRSMLLRSLPDGEGVEGSALEPASVGDRVRHGVGAEGESADASGGPEVCTHGLESDLADEELALGAHGGAARIHVPGRTSAAREGKGSDGEGTLGQKGPEAIAVIHPEQVPPAPRCVKARAPGASGRSGRASARGLRAVVRPGGWIARRKGEPGRFGFGTLLLLALGLSACSDPIVPLPNPRFGQVGEIQVDVRSGLGQFLGGGAFQGTLHETLTWRSDGGWSIAERVSYNGVLGAESIRKSRLNPGEGIAEYQEMLTQLTESDGSRLLGIAPQGLFPVCGSGSNLGLTTQVTVTIRDDVRDESLRWVRCTYGFLLSGGGGIGLDPSAAGPDANAGRVIAGGLLVRDAVLGEAPLSTYAGTVPFATLARGENSTAQPVTPSVFLSTDGEAPQAFRDFWTAHAGANVPLPQVRWGSEIVILAAVGPREEAGDSVQVRRITRLGAGQGSRVDVVERIPGDFCSPAARRIYPYHLVVAPNLLFPVQFSAPGIERIPCGF